MPNLEDFAYLKLNFQMKKIFTITLLSFLFFACQSDTQNTATADNAATAAPVDAHAGHAHAADDATPNHVEASALAPFLGKWLLYAAIKDTEYYKGKYLDFRGNGTFTSGVDGVKNNSGNWTYDEATKIIDIDFADNSNDRDEQWKAHSQSPNVIILMGNTPKNPSGNQIKLERVPR